MLASITFAMTAAMLAALPASAAPLTVEKTSAVVSDPLGNRNPLRVPGAEIDYTTSITSPISNTLAAPSDITFNDRIPVHTVLEVKDLGLLNAGPVAIDGNLLSLSGLSYQYEGLDSMSDDVDFSDDGGRTWQYVPVPDANGDDVRVTNIRVRLRGSQAAGSTVSIRFRVRVR